MPRDLLRLLPRPRLGRRPTGEPGWGPRRARESGQLPACRPSRREGGGFPSHPQQPTASARIPRTISPRFKSRAPEAKGCALAPCAAERL